MKAQILNREGKHVRRVPLAEGLGLLRRGDFVLVRTSPLVIRPRGDDELRRCDVAGITPADMRHAVGEPCRGRSEADLSGPRRRARGRIAGWANGRTGA